MEIEAAMMIREELSGNEAKQAEERRENERRNNDEGWWGNPS